MRHLIFGEFSIFAIMISLQLLRVISSSSKLDASSIDASGSIKDAKHFLPTPTSPIIRAFTVRVFKSVAVLKA